jgi:hypothetical protein
LRRICACCDVHRLQILHWMEVRSPSCFTSGPTDHSIQLPDAFNLCTAVDH